MVLSIVLADALGFTLPLESPDEAIYKLENEYE